MLRPSGDNFLPTRCRCPAPKCLGPTWAGAGSDFPGAWPRRPRQHAKLANLGAERSCRRPAVRPGRDTGVIDVTDRGGIAALAGCRPGGRQPGIVPLPARRFARLTAAGVGGRRPGPVDAERPAPRAGRHRTKGKSTTPRSPRHLIARLGYRVMVGGNIGARRTPRGDAPVWQGRVAMTTGSWGPLPGHRSCTASPRVVAPPR